MHVPVVDEPVATSSMSSSVIAGSFISKSSKIFSNFGMMKIMMKVKMPTATDDDHDRVDHGAA